MSKEGPKIRWNPAPVQRVVLPSRARMVAENIFFTLLMLFGVAILAFPIIYAGGLVDGWPGWAVIVSWCLSVAGLIIVFLLTFDAGNSLDELGAALVWVVGLVSIGIGIWVSLNVVVALILIGLLAMFWLWVVKNLP